MISSTWSVVVAPGKLKQLALFTIGPGQELHWSTVCTDLGELWFGTDKPGSWPHGNPKIVNGWNSVSLSGNSLKPFRTPQVWLKQRYPIILKVRTSLLPFLTSVDLNMEIPAECSKKQGPGSGYIAPQQPLLRPIIGDCYEVRFCEFLFHLTDCFANICCSHEDHHALVLGSSLH
jgi:hypothetical protein